MINWRDPTAPAPATNWTGTQPFGLGKGENSWYTAVHGTQRAGNAAAHDPNVPVATQRSGDSMPLGARGNGTATTVKPGEAWTGAAGGTPAGAGAAPGAAPPAGNAFGSQSGPGILESWFNQRATGADPAYQYAMNRGMDAVDNRMAAGGAFNSGARGQQLSDFAANMGAQRSAQIDSLAAGASGEHLGRLGLMFNQGMGLANGESGLATAYDLGAAGNMQAANQAQQQMNLNKAGVDSQFAQGRLNTAINAYTAYNSGGSGK